MCLPLRIISLNLTCSACPSQWDAVTVEGQDVYIRYRWGLLEVCLGGVAGESVFKKQLGDSLDGVLLTSELLEIEGLFEWSNKCQVH